jgi:diguanylate cyclase (GGDEF)-like protein
MKNFFAVFFIFLIFSSSSIAQISLDTLSIDYHRMPDSQKAELLKDVGLGYLNLNDYTRSLTYLNHSLRLYRKSGNKEGISEVLNNLGTIHHRLGTYENALAFHLESLTLDEAAGDKIGIAQSCNNIGNVYQNLKKYAEALEYYNRALKINYEINDLDAASKTLNNLGNILLSLESFDQAVSYYQKSLTLKEELNNDYGKAVTLNNIGMAYQGLNNFAKARENYEHSLRLMEKLEDDQGIASSNYHIGLLFFQQNNYDSALQYLNRALEYAIIGNDLNIQKNTYQLLASIYADRQNFRSAYQNYLLFSKIKDDLFNEINNRNITEMKIRYETENKQTEIELLQQATELQNFIVKRQQAFLFGFVIGFIILAIIAFYGYAQYRLKARSYQIIEDQNKQLKEAADKMKKLSKTDSLTKLLTKQDIMEKINYEIIRYNRSKISFTLAICDIDNLNSINERFTTDCGDILLRSIAELIRKKLRNQDSIARWNGGSFLIMLPETDLEGSKIASEKIRKEVKNYEMIYGRYTVKATITIGLSAYSTSEDLQKCLNMTAEALKYGKTHHKNCVIAFEDIK